MKKKTLRFMTAAMAMSMMLMPAISAQAAVNITVNGNAKEYQAYKLMNLTTSLKAGDTHEAGQHTKDCYNYSYTVNSKYADIMRAAAGNSADADGNGTVSDTELVGYVEGLDADGIRAFADNVFEGLGTLDADYTSTGNIFTVDTQGYYLIAESQKADDPDSVSLVMLNTAGQENITVTSKEGIPTLEKKIKDGDSYADAVDAAVGDTVEFRLTGSMPENISNYKTYKYVFHDTMDRGLSFGAVASVTIDGTAVDAGMYSVSTDALADGCSFELVFEDIKALGFDITTESKVVVNYTAVVNENLTVGNPGMPNDAHLEFSNDPYGDGTGNTPEDTVKVFDFAVIINKVDKGNNPLAGAAFDLFVKNGDNWDAVAMTASTATSFTFSGLEQGSYKLVETKVPDGFNKADDVYFDIEAVYDTESDDPQITSMVIKQDGKVVSEGENALFEISANLGTAEGSVVNTSGIQLPHTGEFGRAVLLYGGAGAIVIAVMAAAFAGRKKKEN